MTAPNTDTVKLLAAWVSLVGIPVMLGIGGWALVSVVEHESRISRIEEWKNAGERWTRQDHQTYASSHDVVHMNVNGKLQDHEDRIRTLEFFKAK